MQFAARDGKTNLFQVIDNPQILSHNPEIENGITKSSSSPLLIS